MRAEKYKFLVGNVSNFLEVSYNLTKSDPDPFGFTEIGMSFLSLTATANQEVEILFRFIQEYHLIPKHLQVISNTAQHDRSSVSYLRMTALVNRVKFCKPGQVRHK